MQYPHAIVAREGIAVVGELRNSFGGGGNKRGTDGAVVVRPAIADLGMVEVIVFAKDPLLKNKDFTTLTFGIQPFKDNFRY